MTLIVQALSDHAFDQAIPDLAKLRIEIFREWPYLYDGDLKYEETYLARFRRSDRAFLTVAKDNGRIVGAATALPMSQEVEAFRSPFETHGYDISTIFYFAESLLLPSYRGKGIGHQFFDQREAHARNFGNYSHAAFCAVIRPQDHPSKPPDYRALDRFWQKRGYEKQSGLTTRFSWKDVGEEKETEKPMQFWIGKL